MCVFAWCVYGAWRFLLLYETICDGQCLASLPSKTTSFKRTITLSVRPRAVLPVTTIAGDGCDDQSSDCRVRWSQWPLRRQHCCINIGVGVLRENSSAGNTGNRCTAAGERFHAHSRTLCGYRLPERFCNHTDGYTTDTQNGRSCHHQ